MQKILLIAVFATIFGMVECMSSQAQQPVPNQPPTELAIDQLKKTVVYLIGQYQENGKTVATVGTGFLIFTPEPRLGDNRGLVWLVTNKHVLRQGSQGPYLKQVTIRFNLKTPKPDGVQYEEAVIPVLSDSGELQWLTDPDDTVDLAVINISPPESIMDAKWLPSSLLTSPEMVQDLHINENDEVLFAGLFTWYPGTKKNYPIVRHGKIALLPQERIPTDLRNPNVTTELYLAEITSFGGNSGSPVFVRIGGLRETASGPNLSGYRYLLLGVMQGFFPQAASFTIDVREINGVVAQNSGIALIVPAHLISRILQTPKARAIIDRVAANNRPLR